MFWWSKGKEPDGPAEKPVAGTPASGAGDKPAADGGACEHPITHDQQLLKEFGITSDLGGLTWREILYRTWRNINDHEILTRASSIAFSAMMAAVPFIALIMTIAIQLLPDMTSPEHAHGIFDLTVEQLQSTLRGLFPEEVCTVIEEQIGRIQNQPPLAFLSISLAITLWTASSLFCAIIDALNRIYGVVESRPYWRLRLTAIFMTILQAVLLFVAMVGIVAWPQIVESLGMSLSEAKFATIVKWFAVSIVVLSSFALTFHVGPDALQRHKWVTPGSIFGSLVFIGATYLFRLYMQNFAHYDRAYGSLGGVMALMLWFYISGLVLLIAAEMNRVIEYAMLRRAALKDQRK